MQRNPVPWMAFMRTALAISLASALFCGPACAAPYPADSGALNVRDFDAKGNGHDDDTAALLAAIAAAGTDTGAFFWRTRIVYLPAGTYLVSRPLVKRYAGGRFGSGMVLVGKSTSGTVIKLADHAPGFADPDAPRGVIMSTAKLLDGTPTSGGKDYTHKGEGNDAYENFVEDLTIEVGAGNPGAIGIDDLTNNIGAIRNVRVTAPRGSGAIGISLQRKWPGPTLLQHLQVQGFDVGIAVANTEYGVTLDHVNLTGQRIGLSNAGNSVAATDLTVNAEGTAIANTAPGGLVTLAHSLLQRGGEGADAFANRGVVVAQGVSLEGFTPPDGAATPLVGVLQRTHWQPHQARLDLPLVDPPSERADPVDAWVNPVKGMHASDKPQDITVALRRAMASGASTIYLPYGRYTISDGIAIPPTVRRIVGMNASITVRPERNPDFARDSGMFRVDQPGPPLRIERLAFDMTDLGDQLAVQVTARRDVMLRDIVTAGTSLLDRGVNGGRVFIEDVCCGAMKIAGPNPVYARQLDTEGGDTRIINDGAPLTILGLKTEGDCTVLDNRNGARSTILGGLVYIVHDADATIPAFRNANSSLQATFVEESLRPASRYAIYLQDSTAQHDVRADSFPARGYGRIVPWLVATDR
jgi:Pectate lyase superfamily protein